MSIQNQFNEAETRCNVIDPLVKKAGWNIADRRSVGFEIPVDGYDAAPANGIAGYYLFCDNGKILTDIDVVRMKPAAGVGKNQYPCIPYFHQNKQ